MKATPQDDNEDEDDAPPEPKPKKKRAYVKQPYKPWPRAIPFLGSKYTRRRRTPVKPSPDEPRVIPKVKAPWVKASYPPFSDQAWRSNNAMPPDEYREVLAAEMAAATAQQTAELERLERERGDLRDVVFTTAVKRVKRIRAKSDTYRREDRLHRRDKVWRAKREAFMDKYHIPWFETPEQTALTRKQWLQRQRLDPEYDARWRERKQNYMRKYMPGWLAKKRAAKQSNPSPRSK